MTNEFIFFCSIAFSQYNRIGLSGPSHMHAFANNKLPQKCRIWALFSIFDSFDERTSLFQCALFSHHNYFLLFTHIFFFSFYLYLSPYLFPIFIVQSFIILILIFVCVAVCFWLFRYQIHHCSIGGLR